MIEIFLGPSSPLFPEGEPRLRYKTAAQHCTWYPTDQPEGVPIFLTPPPDTPPVLKEFEDWPEYEEIKKNIMRDSIDRRFFEQRHEDEWCAFFDSFPASLSDLPSDKKPVWRFPPPRDVTLKMQPTGSTHHIEPVLAVRKQPLQWSGHELRQGPLQTPRNGSRGRTCGRAQCALPHVLVML